MSAPRDPVDDLRRIAFLMERRQEATYRVRAFRRAADVLSEIPVDSLQRRVELGTLRQLPGIGEKTAAVVAQSLAGQLPDYLVDLEQGAGEPSTARARCCPARTARRRPGWRCGTRCAATATPTRLVRRRLADPGDGAWPPATSATRTWC